MAAAVLQFDPGDVEVHKSPDELREELAALKERAARVVDVKLLFASKVGNNEKDLKAHFDKRRQFSAVDADSPEIHITASGYTFAIPFSYMAQTSPISHVLVANHHEAHHEAVREHDTSAVVIPAHSIWHPYIWDRLDMFYRTYQLDIPKDKKIELARKRPDMIQQPDATVQLSTLEVLCRIWDASLVLEDALLRTTALFKLHFIMTKRNVEYEELVRLLGFYYVSIPPVGHVKEVITMRRTLMAGVLRHRKEINERCGHMFVQFLKSNEALHDDYYEAYTCFMEMENGYLLLQQRLQQREAEEKKAEKAFRLDQHRQYQPREPMTTMPLTTTQTMAPQTMASQTMAPQIAKPQTMGPQNVAPQIVAVNGNKDMDAGQGQQGQEGNINTDETAYDGDGSGDVTMQEVSMEDVRVENVAPEIQGSVNTGPQPSSANDTNADESAEDNVPLQSAGGHTSVQDDNLIIQVDDSDDDDEESDDQDEGNDGGDEEQGLSDVDKFLAEQAGPDMSQAQQGEKV